LYSAIKTEDTQALLYAFEKQDWH